MIKTGIITVIMCLILVLTGVFGVRDAATQESVWVRVGNVPDNWYKSFEEPLGSFEGEFGDAGFIEYIDDEDGDVVQIYNPETLEMLQEVTLTSDVDATDTSISFSSVTLGNNIPPDSKIMLKGSEGFATPMLRTDEIQIGGNTYTDIAPTTEYYYGADTGSDVLPITASSTFYVVNTGSFNTSYGSRWKATSTRCRNCHGHGLWR